VAVGVEGVAVGDLAVDAADGEVHLREPPGGVVRLLAVDRDVGLGLAAGRVAVPVAVRVGADELQRLNEHPARAAAGVVDPTAVGLDHLDEQVDHAVGRQELAPLAALGERELLEEVLVDAAEHVLGAGFLVADLDVADHVDQLAEARLVERRAGVVLGQYALEHGIVALDAGHGVVHEPADGGLLRLGLQVRPARFGRHPEDAQGAVLVGVLGVGALGLLGDEPRVVLLEGVGDVLEEDETQDDVLVLGRVHAAAQGVGHLPELGLVADVGRGRVRLARLGLSLRQCLPRLIASLRQCLGAPKSRRSAVGRRPVRCIGLLGSPVAETLQEGIIDLLRSEPLQLFLQRHAFDLG
jgi:hypothetical protein